MLNALCLVYVFDARRKKRKIQVRREVRTPVLHPQEFDVVPAVLSLRDYCSRTPTAEEVEYAQLIKAIAKL